MPTDFSLTKKSLSLPAGSILGAPPREPTLNLSLATGAGVDGGTRDANRFLPDETVSFFHYRGTSLTRRRTPLAPYRRPMPRVLGGS